MNRNKVKYEVFDTATGKWQEDYTTQDEIDQAMEVFLEDYEYYESEKEIIHEIVKQNLAKKKNKEKD
tara:strand:- start:1117 stop:1317 length:201 start_codon:yes stop_codon:yes gene_type:complete